MRLISRVSIAIFSIMMLTGAREADPIQFATSHGATGPLHYYDDGSALSADGQYLAIAMPSTSVNELNIVDLDKNNRVRLFVSNRTIKLSEPAFSKDGKFLAVIVSPPNYNGYCELWIYNMASKSTQVISGDRRCFRHPSFDSDGRHILYFRDVDPPPLPNSNPIAARYAELHAYSIFERDLLSGQEVRLLSNAFSWPMFALRGRDEVIFSAGMPLLKQLREPDHREYWTLVGASVADPPPVSVFHFRPQTRLPAEQYTPIGLSLENSERGSLDGVSDNGSLLVYSSVPTASVPTPGAFKSYLSIFRDGQPIRIFSRVSAGYELAAISADSSTVVAVLPPSDIAVQRQRRQHQQLSWSAIALSGSAQIPSPPQTSIPR